MALFFKMILKKLVHIDSGICKIFLKKYLSSHGKAFFSFMVIGLLFFYFSAETKAQNLPLEKPCLQKLGKGYLTDGQDHQIPISSTRFSQLHVVFYPQFNYKIIICGVPETDQVNFQITDEKGSIVFDNQKVNYAKEWEFTYASLMKAIIKIKLTSNKTKDQTVKVVIGYKLMDKITNTNE